MILGIGIDLVDLRRIERIYGRFGERFLSKFLAPQELSCQHMRRVSYMAGRFAAKEAAVKALGTGFANGIGPRQIVIVNDAQGRPQISFLEHALERAKNLGAVRAQVSISHERACAAAVVILEG